MGQRAYVTLADADHDTIQRDQFWDGLPDSDIQESFWRENIDWFGPTIEGVWRLDSINKAKQMKQRRPATLVVRPTY